MRLRNARVAGAIVLLWVVACADAARSGERFVAAHGFSEPVPIAATPGPTHAALAFEAGIPYVYWYDSAGVRRRRVATGSEAELRLPGRGVRNLLAVTADGDPALFRVVRDLGTGRNVHEVVWRGESRTIAASLQMHRVALAAGGAGPAWAMRVPVDSGSALEVAGWDRPAVTVRESPESIAQLDLAVGPDGSWWVSWLEGSSDRTALGVASDWRAYVARVDPAGTVGAVVELGAAANRGSMDATHVHVDAGAAIVLWTDRDGRVVAARMANAAGAFQGVSEPELFELGMGMAAGVFDGAAYWADGDRIRRRALASVADVETILWAPNAILGITAAEDASGTLFLAWHGGSLRGDTAVYAAGNHTSFEPAWIDRVAAAMGWSPWEPWSEALGQLLASLLAGTLVTMALAPVLWGASALAVRVAEPEHATSVGIGIGGAAVGAILALARTRAVLPASVASSLFGAWWQIGIALAVAAVSTWLLRRRADAEPLLGTLVAAASCSGIAVALLAFFTFQAWSEGGPGAF